MAVLSDRTLALIYPEHKTFEPASINLHLGDSLLVWPSSERRDPRIDQSDLWRQVPLRQIGEPAWILMPHFRYLATTRERVTIPANCAGQIGARSSWARDGLAVIQGPAGWLDSGYRGRPTLELSVVGSELVIWPGAAICQLVLHQLDTPCERPYGHPSRQSKYQSNEFPTPSLTHLEVTA